MRYIEQGIDKYSVTCWYVVDDAELIGEYYTLTEAEVCQETGICNL